MNILSDVDRGYIAGMLDGEGCIYKRKTVVSFTVSITNTNKQGLNRIKRLTGIGYVGKKPSRPEHSDCYRWCVYMKRDVLDLLTILAPILVIKQEKARAAIKLLTHSKSLDTSPL